MKKKKVILRLLGLPLLAVGCIMLALGYPTKLNNSNAYLLVSLIAVLAGGLVYVWKKKCESDY